MRVARFVVPWLSRTKGVIRCLSDGVCHAGGRSNIDDLPRRKAHRLRGYDYALPGAYFVTVCTQGRLRLLGSIEDDQMLMSPAGTMVDAAWRSVPDQVPGVTSGGHIVMPDHIHGIWFLNPNGAEQRCDLTELVARFKSITTHRYLEGIVRDGWPRFSIRLWQRSFYDRVLRNDAELDGAGRYVSDNLARHVAKPGQHHSGAW